MPRPARPRGGARARERPSEPLVAAYDLAMLDLDGVVYVGGDAVPGAPSTSRARARPGMRLAFITNNAARPPEAVAEHLRELGIEADAEDVVTSAQAAAHGAARAARRGRAGWCVLGGRRAGEALRRGRPGAGRRRRRGRGGGGDRLRAGRAVARHHAGRGADPRRAAVGGQQHRPDDARPPYGVAPGHGVLVETAAPVRRRRAGGGRQAGSDRCSTRPCAGSAASGR